jgi:hypothetical protein
MSTTRILACLLTLLLGGLFDAAGQDDLARAREAFLADSQRALKPVEAAYLEKLVMLRYVFSKTNREQEAQAVDEEIQALQGRMKRMASVTSDEQAGALRIVAAIYSAGTKYADVTSRVAALLRSPKVIYEVTPTVLKADPAPGFRKRLLIVYESEAGRHMFSAAEVGGHFSYEALLARAQKKLPAPR